MRHLHPMMLRMGKGMGRSSSVGGASSPILYFTGSSVLAEDIAINTTIGTLAVAGLGALTVTSYSVTVDADNKFTNTASALKVDQALNYETKTTHSVTCQALLSDLSTISATFDFTVTNVLEITLATLTLSTPTVEEGTAAGTFVSAIVGTTSGSSLSMTFTDGSRFALSGNSVVTGSTATDYATAISHDITISETHPDGINSPMESTVTIAVTLEALDPPTDVVWTTTYEDTTPGFSLNLPDDVVAGDILVSVYATNGSVTDPATWTELFRYAVTAQDIIDDEININGLTPLDEGFWDFVFRMERGASVSAWTATVDVTIGTPTPPPSGGGTPIGLLLALTKSTTDSGSPTGLLLTLTKAS